MRTFTTRLVTGAAGLVLSLAGVAAVTQQVAHDASPKPTAPAVAGVLRPGQTLTGSGGNLPTGPVRVTGRGGSGGCAAPILLAGSLPLCPGQSVTGSGGNLPTGPVRVTGSGGSGSPR